MRGVAQWRRFDRVPTRDDLVDFDANRDHRLDEAFDFDQIFRLGRFDHEGARDGEREGRRVESEVDEALRDVFGGDARFRGELAQIENALVRDEAVVAGEKYREVLAEPRSNIIGA